jgi:hypothetical protein
VHDAGTATAQTKRAADEGPIGKVEGRNEDIWVTVKNAVTVGESEEGDGVTVIVLDKSQQVTDNVVGKDVEDDGGSPKSLDNKLGKNGTSCSSFLTFSFRHSLSTLLRRRGREREGGRRDTGGENEINTNARTITFTHTPFLTQNMRVTHSTILAVIRRISRTFPHTRNLTPTHTLT